MALQYEVKTKRPGLAKNKTPLHYPVLTDRRVADLSMVAEKLNERTTLTQADIIAVIEALTHVIPELLEEGYNVKLNQLGTFSVHAKATGKADPSKVTVRDIQSLTMAFLPSKRMKRKIQRLKVQKKGR